MNNYPFDKTYWEIYEEFERQQEMSEMRDFVRYSDGSFRRTNQVFYEQREVQRSAQR